MGRWLRFTSAAVGLLLAATLSAIAFGQRRDRAMARELEAAIVAQSRSDAAPASSATDRSALDAIPTPVARYLRLVLRDGQPPIALTRFDQRGEIRTDLSSTRWYPFTAHQDVAVRQPGFVWDARVRLAPFVHIRVRDQFVGGSGAMMIRPLSAFTAADERGGSLTEGELYRFLAEAPLYPTALVPGGHLLWSALDDHRARATLTNGQTSVSVEFRFSDAGEVTSIYAANRARKFGTEYVPTPWEGHWKRYAERGGMRLPTEGEVGWWVDGTLQLVWRGTVLSQSFSER